MNDKKLTTKILTNSGTTFGWGLNTYNGCKHGCFYCYGQAISHKDRETFMDAKARKDLIVNLKKDIVKIKTEGAEVKDIFVCSICDAYQPLELEYELTKQAIEVFIDNELPFTVLTKSSLVLRDLDVFKSYDKCRVGLTVITLDDDFRKILEPNASPIKDRIFTLRMLKKNGIPTYCSVEPIMSCKESNPIEIVKELRDYVDLFEFGKWNPREGLNVPVKYDEGYYVGLFKELFQYCEDENITHCVASHSVDFLKKNRISYIPPLLVTDRPYPRPGSVKVQ